MAVFNKNQLVPERPDRHHQQRTYCYPPIISQCQTFIPQSPIPQSPIPQIPYTIPPLTPQQQLPCGNGQAPSAHFNFSQPLPLPSHQSQMNNHEFAFSPPPLSPVNELFPVLSDVNSSHMNSFLSPTCGSQVTPVSSYFTGNGSSQVSPQQFVPADSTSKLQHYSPGQEQPEGNSLVPVFPAAASSSSPLPPVQAPTNLDVGNQTINHLIVQVDDQIPGGVYIPPSTPDPGEYGFKLHFSETVQAGSKSSWLFVHDTNTLFVRPWSDFAVMFKFEKPCPPDCSVRVMVCFKEPVEAQKHGPITKCLKHLSMERDTPHADHFMLSKAPDASYGQHHTHGCVTVPVGTMAVSDHGPFAVFSYACYSSCIVGNGKNKPSLITIFSLMHKGAELGRDVITVRSCACPFRDLSKAMAPAKDSTPSRHRRGRTVTNKDKECVRERSPSARHRSPTSSVPIHPALDLADRGPDEDGYYTFTWRTKDRGVYNTLLMMKKGYEAMGSD